MTDAPPPPLRGRLEQVTRTLIAGWAMDPAAPGAPVTLELLIDDAAEGTLPARLYREDLEKAGIGDGNHDAGDARCDDRIGAGRGLSMMRARFERDIGRGSPRLLARFGNGLGLCMGTTAQGGDAAPDDFAILDDDAADRGIGAGAADMGFGKPDCLPHIPFVAGRNRHVVNPPCCLWRSWR